ncbi:MAG: sporulation protein YqfD [Bacillota bacterium]
MIKRILYYIKGYLIVDLKGNALERLLSQIIESGINLWSIKRISKNHYQAGIDAADFKKLRTIFRKRMCTVKINRKVGLPFWENKLKKRFSLVLAIILFFLIFYTASSFLWFINIEGLNNIADERIYEILTQNNIKPGVLKQRLDVENIEKILLREEPRISWIDVTWQGTRLNIEVVEKKLVEKDEANKIIANKSGIITELIVLKGHPVVKEGETVNKNQILIVPENENEKVQGIVKAEVWYESFGKAKFKDITTVYTGNSINKWKIKFGSKEYNISGNVVDFDSYIVERSKKIIPEWRNINIPIEVIKEKYKEVEYIIKNRDRDQTLYVAKNEAFKKILNKLDTGTVILESKFEIYNLDEEDKAGVRMLLKTEENIAKKISNK